MTFHPAAADQGVAIYGGGGHARVVASILRALALPILGFFDDAPTGVSPPSPGVSVLGRGDQIAAHRDQITGVYLAMGDNLARSQAFERFSDQGFEMPPLVHPAACVESDAQIGQGTVVCMGAMVATQAVVGCACILNTGCCLDHESTLGNFVHLAPHAAVAGRTSIGSHTFVGMGAVVAQGLTIGKRSMIGANATVLSGVEDNTKVLGVHHAPRA